MIGKKYVVCKKSLKLKRYRNFDIQFYGEESERIRNSRNRLDPSGSRAEVDFQMDPDPQYSCERVRIHSKYPIWRHRAILN